MITMKYLGGCKEKKELNLDVLKKPDIFIGLVQGKGTEEVIKEFQDEVYRQRDSTGQSWIILCECDIGDKIAALSREFENRMSYHFLGKVERNGLDGGTYGDIDSFLKRQKKIKSLFKLGACNCDFELAEILIARMICLGLE